MHTSKTIVGKDEHLITRQRIFITGCVQGVGFRPGVYRLAKQLSLAGFVYNDTRGVTIELQGEQERIVECLRRLQDKDKPPLAEIISCRTVDIDIVEGEEQFVISESDSAGTAFSQVTADMAICGDCRADRRFIGVCRTSPRHARPPSGRPQPASAWPGKAAT